MAIASKQVELHLFFLSTAVWGNKVKYSDGKLDPLLKILQMEEFPKVRATVSVTWPLLPPFHGLVVSLLPPFHGLMASLLPSFYGLMVSLLLSFHCLMAFVQGHFWLFLTMR